MKCVIVNYIQNHPEAHTMQCLHHLPELQDSLPSIRIAGVAAFRDPIMDRIIAPVEGVLIRHRQDSTLLLLTVRAKSAQITLQEASQH